MREIGDILHAFERDPGRPFALATLVRARGSSYRRPGARMLISMKGRAAGSLSGGCLEDEVAARAREVLLCGEPAWMEFDTRRRFGCHGAIEIFIERAQPAFLAEVAANFHARRPSTAVTIFTPDAPDVGTRMCDEATAVPASALVQQIVPPVQLLIFGDGPDSAALHGFAQTLGWRAIFHESAADLNTAGDAWTVAVVKTHSYGRDFAALHALMPLGLRYVGLLGPRRRRDQLLGDLAGLCPNLFAPAGLDLGGDSPESIALSIVAEIQAVLSGGSRQSLRDRRAPIHANALATLAAAH